MKIQTVLISGKQGSGKTTLANELLKTLRRNKTYVSHMTFATPLYQMHDYCRGLLKDAGINFIHQIKDGNLLQLLGTEWGRQTISTDIWIDVAKGRIQKTLNKEAYGYENAIFIFSDCRFENEFDAFPEALRVRLCCPDDVRKERAEMWRENVEHASEINLDHYSERGLFDKYFNTLTQPVREIATLIDAQLAKDSWIEKR